MATLTLFALPSELLMQIVLLLDYHDRVQLNATCTHLNKIVEPFIWSNIEFHFDGYHESSYELNDPPPYIPVSERAYQDRRKPEEGVGFNPGNKANCFLDLLVMYYITDQSRLQKICSRVKHLCTGACCNWYLWTLWSVDYTDPRISFWNILPFFNNLVTLELHADNGYPRSVQANPLHGGIQAAPLTKLCFVKLFGHIPPEVARWVLKGGCTLERLELGLLDRPVSTDVHPPLPEENLNIDADDDAASDYGSLCARNVIPRPLGGILPDDIEVGLPNLKVLYLCSPADTPSPYSRVTLVMDYSFSSRAERSSLSDWRKLLMASEQTLETLVLEHRPGAENIERDGLGPQEYSAQNKDGRINAALVKMVETLLERQDSFPALEMVYLYGFAVGEDPANSPDENTHGGRLMHTLKARGVRCEARRGTWCQFEGDSGCAFWCNWEWESWTEASSEHGDDYIPKETWDTLLADV